MAGACRPRMRRVILNMHMPKTGGTTLDAALGRSFGAGHRNMSYLVEAGAGGRAGGHLTWGAVARMRDLSGTEAVWSLSTRDIVEMLDADAGIVSLSRHGLYADPICVGRAAGQGGCGGYDLRPIFFVRRFAPWHMSLYRQQRGDPDSLVRLSRDPRAILAKTGSPREYARFCIDNADILGNHKIMHNWTGAQTDAVLGSLGLYQVGLTERYDESLVAIEDALSADFPGLDLSYPRPLNAGGGGPSGRAELARQIGDGLLRELEAAYAEDAVYDRIASELDARISRVRDFGGRLDAFRARCAARRADFAPRGARPP